MVSAYESGRREPSISTLERLVTATGHRMVIQLERNPNTPLGLPDSPLGRRLRQHRKAVLACAARHGATNVRVFGSVARGEDQANSDLDLVVDLAPRTGLFALGALKRELTEIVGTSVDVAPSDSLRPEVKSEVERDAVPL